MVSAPQLSTRLNNISNQVVRTNVSFEPDQLITSWLVARLRAGVEPQFLVDELVTVREKLRVDADRDALSDVLRSFGLLSRGRTMNDACVLCQPGLTSPVTTVVLPETPAPPAESLSVHPSVCRNVSPSSVTGRWWSHRRNNSSTSRLHNLASLINPDRRPSLPVLSSPGLPSTVSYRPTSRMGTYHNSSSSLVNRNSSTPRRLSNLTQREVSSMPELLASLMAFDNPEDIRFILLDHLLRMRYSLHSEQWEDWFLGEGRIRADETLTGIEIRFVGCKNDVSLKGIFVDLRHLFGLPDSTTITGSAYTAKHHSLNQMVEHSSVRPPRPSLASYASEMPKPSSSLHEEDGKSEASFSVCGREVYFDLDDYISDMSPNVYSPTYLKSTVPFGSDSSSGATYLKRAADRKSTGAESQLTTATLLTDFSPCRASFLSAYTIREATRGYATESVGTQVSVPPRITSMTDLQAAYISKPTSFPDGSSDLERFWHHNIGTRSEPELLELLDALAMDAGHYISSHGHDGGVKNSQLSSVCLRQMARLRDRPALGPSVQELCSTYARTRSPSTTHNFTLDPSGEYHSTPIAIPTVPFVPHLAYIPSIPSISSGEGATTNVNKNLAGLDTPPASPPIPDGSVIPNCLFGLAAETASPMKTSLDEGNRNFNRQLAIFDGTHVSPPREMPISVCGDDSESKYTTPISEPSPNVNEDDPVGTGVSGPKTRSVSQQAAGLGDLKPLPQLPSSDAEERAVSLLDVIVLFDITNGKAQPRAGLQYDEVSSVLRKIVNSSSGEEARAEWLLSQMASLVSIVRFFQLVFDLAARRTVWSLGAILPRHSHPTLNHDESRAPAFFTFTPGRVLVCLHRHSTTWIATLTLPRVCRCRLFRTSSHVGRANSVYMIEESQTSCLAR